MTSFLQIPDTNHYWLRNGRISSVLLANTERESVGAASDEDPLADIEIFEGRVRSIQHAGETLIEDIPAVDVRSGLIWPCFVDVHTHLDKGHIWARSPNPDGSFDGALTAVRQDSEQFWSAQDIYQRASFGLKCSYVHGTQAIRTHLDSFGEQGRISFEVFNQLRKEWSNRIALQAVALVTLDYYEGDAGESLADLVAEYGGILGGVAFMNTEIDAQIERVFDLAIACNLDLDFHTDETLDPAANALKRVALTAIKKDFKGKITCGHCCSLSTQANETVAETLDLVKRAGISVVSLPMCNLYLQGRQQGHTPRYRGVTVLKEMKAVGVECAIASDNCRDPFYAYGDHDGLEVFTQSVRIAQLDHPIGDWATAITSTPARMMGLADIGEIRVGGRADLVVFKARTLNELMARRQCDRVVIRSGKQVSTALPDYRELDNL